MQKKLLFSLFLFFSIIICIKAVSADTYCEWGNNADGTGVVAHYNLTTNNPEYDCSGKAPHTGSVNRTWDFFGSPVSSANGTTFWGSTGSPYGIHTNLTYLNFALRNYTICFNASDVPSGSDSHTVLNKFIDNFVIWFTAGKLQMRNDVHWATTVESVSDGKFEESCVRKNGTHLSISINGKHNVSSTEVPFSLDDSHPLYLGISHPGDGSGFIGTLKDLTIYDYALSSQNISDRFAKVWAIDIAVNNNITFPATPSYNTTFFAQVNVTSPGYLIERCNFTLTAPNSTEILSDVNGSNYLADLWNSSSYYISNATTNLGDWTIEANCEDNVSNPVSKDWIFTVSDTSAPFINITAPFDNYNSSSSLMNLNRTLSDDIELDTCTYLFYNYSNNVSLKNGTFDCSSNTSTLSSPLGHSNLTIIANDTSGNSNTAMITGINITADTTNPEVAITSPSGTITGLSYNLIGTVADNGIIDDCWYRLTAPDTPVTNTSLNCSGGSFSKALTTTYYGSHTIIVGVNDTEGNTNETNVTFITEQAAATPAPGGGGAGGDEEEPSELICEVKGWYVKTPTGTFSYEILIPKESARPRCKDIILQNTGTEPVEITLECLSEEGFCKYVEIEETSIILPANMLEEKRVKFCMEIPENRVYGDELFWEVLVTDKEACEGILAVSARVSIFGNLFKWSELPTTRIGADDNFQYPIIAPASILAVLAAIGTGFALRKRRNIAILLAVLLMLLSFIGLILVL